ncbi:MAG: lactate utilization protein [Candidatus Omnitrophica bacterium]|nr:lactate utilization protein [Candidatus Omnitrophota bacterium]
MVNERAEALIKIWGKKNIKAEYFAQRQVATEKILSLIPLSASVGFSGSVTLDELQVIAKLEARGNKVFNPYKAGISREESLAIRKQASSADYYLASANGISQNGELVFLSAYGNRTSGIAYAKNVIIVCGMNKITQDLGTAVKRSREYATPLNIKRLNWDANKIMCCQTLIIEAEATPDRLRVILVGEGLGF